MVDELMIAFVASLVFSCVVFFPLKLSGLWVLFWMTYYCTLSIGIGAAQRLACTCPDPVQRVLESCIGTTYAASSARVSLSPR